MIIVGYTTREHLLLDLDDTSKFKALGLIRLIMRSWPEVGDALVLYSSACTCKRWLHNPSYMHLKLARRRENYHVVFNNSIGYEKCCQIIFTLAELDALDRQFLEIRSFRGDMTLRVSTKPLSVGTTPAPTPVNLIRNRNSEMAGPGISRYLSFRSLVLSSDHSSHPQRMLLWAKLYIKLPYNALAKLTSPQLRRCLRRLSHAHAPFNHLPQPCSTAAA